MAMTMVPTPKMAATFVTKSKRAPPAWFHWCAFKVSPTTARGGTNEMAMATPGSVSEMSRRISAMDPTAPVANAARRSMRRGSTRDATWALFWASTGPTTTAPSSQPMPMAAKAPAITRPTDLVRFFRSPRTAASMVPWMGTMRGATIMAPITVAVESPTMPAPGDDRRQHHQHPESAQPSPDFGPLEEDGIAHVGEVLTGNVRH